MRLPRDMLSIKWALPCKDLDTRARTRQGIRSLAIPTEGAINQFNAMIVLLLLAGSAHELTGRDKHASICQAGAYHS